MVVPTLTIVGAGVCGRALAALVHPDRFDVTLIEQRPDRVELGTAFGIWPRALRVLQTIGVADRIRADSVGAARGELYDGTGRRLAAGAGPGILLTPRSTLLAALAEAIPSSVRRVRARVEDPDTLDGDLVIAADGARSVIRRRIWGQEPRSAGVWALRGVLADPALAEGVAREYWSPSGVVGITPHAGPSTNWYATLAESAPDAAAALVVARRTYATHPEQVRRVLDAASAGQTAWHEILEARSTTQLVSGRYVLVGDAAHAMSPHLGRGACESLMDAAVLARALNAAGPDGARAYQRSRLVPPQLIRMAGSGVRRLAVSGPTTYGVLRTLTRAR